mgnify:CR=1 FL=1
MYQQLSSKKTKSHYKRILKDTIAIVAHLLEQAPDSLTQNIYDQLLDIQKNVVDEKIYSGWEQINERYTLGAIAVKNYEEDEEMYQRLCDIFGGAILYSEMP